MILPDLLKTSDKDSLCIADGVSLTYGDLDALSSSVAVELRKKGVKVGDRVAVYLPNSWQFVSILFGIFKAGAIATLLDFRSSRREIEFMLNDSMAALLFADESRWKTLSPTTEVPAILSDSSADATFPLARREFSEPPPIDEEAVALILYTGGTTGRSKGVLLTHRNILSVLGGLSNSWRLQKEKEVFAQILPMTHAGGLNCGLNSALFSGGMTVMIRRFEPSSFIDSVLTNKITAFSAVPTIYWNLVSSENLEKLRSSSLRICFSSGAHLSSKIAELFKEKTGITINVGWGLTESSPQLTVAPLGIFKENYVGRPIDKTELVSLDADDNPRKKGEVGELAAKGPQVMKGYWKNEFETAKVFTRDHYLKTGDVGYVSDEGVYLLGRTKDVINSGGYKIWPTEVERVLMEEKNVKEAAVVAVMDDKFGEAVKAFVVLKSKISEEELRTFCRARLSSYKVPRVFEFVDSLPRSSVGKILHRVLRDQEKEKIDATR